MSDVFVYYKGANQHSISAGPEHRVVLNPGRNVVNKTVWQKILDVAEKNKEKGGVVHLMNEGLIKILDSEDAVLEESSDLNISELNQKDALEIIGVETDEENLLTFIDQESNGKKRDKVLAAIDDRIALLSEDPDGTSDT